ncbi:MAG TPA: molecular chaperone DnaJ, partial [Archangium sp.]
MSSSSTAPLAPESALLRVAPPPEESPLRRAELRLKELLAELEALDAEIDSLGVELERFARVYEDALSSSFEEVGRSERLLRRLRNVQDAAAALLRRLEQPEPPPDAAHDSRQRPDSTSPASAPHARAAEHVEDDELPEDADAFADEEDAEDDAPSEQELLAEREDEAVVLKRLHRRLARLLHPDLAQSEEERKRLDALMARVNVAYEAGDRTTLELIAARVGAGDTADSLSDDDRLAHLERRIRTLTTAAHSLRQQRESLRSTATARLHEESRRRAAEGRDYLAETRAEMDEELHGLAQDARARMRQLERAARAITSLRNKRMSTLV